MLQKNIIIIPARMASSRFPNKPLADIEGKTMIRRVYEQALQAISYNMKLGIGGVVTFKNGRIDQFLHQIDLKHLVLETDAPYLAPVPHRGKRNESSYLINVATKLAEIYEVPVEEIANQTTENAKAIFGI